LVKTTGEGPPFAAADGEGAADGACPTETEATDAAAEAKLALPAMTAAAIADFNKMAFKRFIFILLRFISPDPPDMILGVQDVKGRRPAFI
jgi:hypothetical protein